ncbi:hypothetical protein [Helicobacter salomonis]|uniref:hypothetical protein n=1 Tax=Helicobacter salomonis TaxID=56878 RepID=UPI000CF1B269|nr:hypothetical protein [Helicobacter salomonis]
MRYCNRWAQTITNANIISNLLMWLPPFWGQPTPPDLLHRQAAVHHALRDNHMCANRVIMAYWFDFMAWGYFIVALSVLVCAFCTRKDFSCILTHMVLPLSNLE